MTRALAAGPGLVFVPDALTIRVQDRVRVTNEDLGAHHDFQVSGQASPDLAPGESWLSAAFTRSGRFTFVCTYHEGAGMTGTVTVTS